LATRPYIGHYKGLVLSHNMRKVPKLDIDGNFYVVLEKREDLNSGHYMSVIKLKDNGSPGYGIFDSYGLPVSKDISDFISRVEYFEDDEDNNYTLSVIKTSNDFQDEKSNRCGAFMLYFLDHLYHIARGRPTAKDFDKVSRKFTRNPSQHNINLLINHFS